MGPTEIQQAACELMRWVRENVPFDDLMSQKDNTDGSGDYGMAKLIRLEDALKKETSLAAEAEAAKKANADYQTQHDDGEGETPYNSPPFFED